MLSVSVDPTRESLLRELAIICITWINEVLKFKGEPVYIDKNEVKIDGILNEDLISMDVYSDDSFIGKVTDILNNGVYDILVIESEKNKSLVPNIGEFVKNIDLDNKKIQINMIEGLINENWYIDFVS